MIVTAWFLDNIDHGALPAGSTAIRNDMGMNNAQYGFLGSVVFGGLAAGSIIGTELFNRISTKWILMVTLVPNALALLGVTMTNNFFLLSACRFLTGFTQVFVGIFIPVWADKFAPSENMKQGWITGVLLASTVGVLVGYVITAYLISIDKWQWSFYLQAMAIVPFELFLLVTPERYLSITDKEENYENNES